MNNSQYDSCPHTAVYNLTVWNSVADRAWPITDNDLVSCTHQDLAIPQIGLSKV